MKKNGFAALYGTLLCVPLMFLPFFCYSHENGIDPSVFPIIDSICQELVDNGDTPGVAIQIGRCFDHKHDTILYQKVFGNRVGAESLTIDTLYDLASITKPTFTASAIMFLIQGGEISDEDYVYTYITGFEQQSKGDVKIKHLLTHTSGLPAYVSTSGLPPRPNADALINRICGLSKTYTTGEGYIYSCLNFILLARIVENVTGESVTQFLTRRMWDEIGMIDSTHFPTDEQISRTAPTLLESVRPRGRVHDPLAWYYTNYDTEEHACGNAGGFSTVLDEARLARLLLHKGTLYGKELYTPQIITLLTTQQTTVASRAYGWDVYTESVYSNPENQTPETCCIGHSGYTGTYMWLDKYSKTYVLVFTNVVYPNDDSAKKSAVIAARQNIVRKTLDHLDIYNDVGEEDFVVDNDSGVPSYTETGTWTQVSSNGYMKKTYAYATAGTSAYADYNLTFSEGGKFRLYAWFPYDPDATTSTRFIIQHKNGTTEKYINQLAEYKTWVYLGEYDFDAATYIVRLDAAGSSGGTRVLSDAIKAECLAHESDVVVDNEDASYSDTAGFFTSTASPLRYGPTYRACNPGEGDTATWQLSIPEPGIWELYEWHNGNETRSPNVPYTIRHAHGAETVYVNQQQNSGRWNSIGRYAFRAGEGIVSISSCLDGIVVADAVKATRISPFEVIIDNLHAQSSDTEDFFTSSSMPLRYDATYRVCPSGIGEQAVWNLNLPYSGTWEIYEWHDGNETCCLAAPFTIKHLTSSTTLHVNQQIHNGQWNSLGQYMFSRGAGSVTLSNDCTAGYVIADAVKAVYMEPSAEPTGSFWFSY